MGSNRVIHFEQNIPVQLALQTVQGLRIRHAGQWQMLFLTVSGQRVYLPESTASTIQRIAKSDEPIVICKRRGRYDVWLAGEAEKQRARDEASEVREFLRDHGAAAGQSGNAKAFPAPPTRQEEREPLKPTGTDSLPVPALQPLKLTSIGPDASLLPKHARQSQPRSAGSLDRRSASGGRSSTAGDFRGDGFQDETHAHYAGDGIPAQLTSREPVRIRPASAPPSKPKPPGRVGYGHALEHICKTVKSVLSKSDLFLGDGPTQDLISTVFIAAQKEKSIDFDFGDVA